MTIEVKPVGIVRKMDELGRIVIPAEVRKANAQPTNQALEILPDSEGGIYIRPFGKDMEKQELVEQLIELKQHTKIPEVFNLVSKAIEFMNERM